MQIARDIWSEWQDSSQPLAVHKHTPDKLLLLHLADTSQFHQRVGGGWDTHMFTCILQLLLPFSVLWENKLTTSSLLNRCLPFLSLKNVLGASWWDLAWCISRRGNEPGAFLSCLNPRAQESTWERKDVSLFPRDTTPVAWLRHLTSTALSKWLMYCKHISDSSLALSSVSENQCELPSVKQLWCCIIASTDESDNNRVIASHW